MNYGLLCFKNNNNITKLTIFKKVVQETVRIDSNWDVASNAFSYQDKILYQIPNSQNNQFTAINSESDLERILKIVGKNKYTFRKGVSAPKSHIYTLKFVEKVDENLSKFSTYEISAGNRLVETDNIIMLETKYIKPLIKSPHIKKLKSVWENQYIIFPYEKQSKKPVSEDVLKSEAPRLYNYLKQNRTIIDQQSSYNSRIQNNEEYYSLIRVGEYTYADHFAVTRDNTSIPFTHISKVLTGWGKLESPVFDGHISFISQDEDNRFISEEEAIYITAILNLQVVSDYILNSSSSRSIGTGFDIKLPIYDRKNAVHYKIYIIASEAIKNSLPYERIEKKIYALYNKIL